MAFEFPPKGKRSTHYSAALNASALDETCTELAASIKRKSEETGLIPLLLYSGMSGIALATAISIALWRDHKMEPMMMYVRKPDEDSHGSRVESSKGLFTQIKWNEEEHKHTKKDVRRLVVFVDDFICSGRTTKRCEVALAEHSANTHRIEWYALVNNSLDIVPEGHPFTVRMG